MKKILFMLLLLNIFCAVKLNSCNKNQINSIDSLFNRNLSSMKEMVGNSSEGVAIRDIEIIKFLYVVASLSGKDFKIDPHNIVINTETILAIEKWYQEKKKYITCDRINKAYSLLYPPLFHTIEEIDKYSEELDQLIIKD